jgi:2-dehydro-3-deoxyphosphogluconate aldolase/(4S)-4-hydroxy-2-oxoglutarate aldolase
VIPVARSLSVARAPDLAAALREGGIELIEVTMEGEDAPRVIETLTGSGTLVGAGTVMTVAEARAAIGSGASFLVSPHLDPNLVVWAAEHDHPYLPGVLSPSEVAMAIGLGTRAVKLFPAGGPAHVAALRGPFPQLALVPSGGVDAGNAAGYMAAGSAAVAVGGWLTAPDDLDLVKRRAAALVAAVI